MLRLGDIRLTEDEETEAAYSCLFVLLTDLILDRFGQETMKDLLADLDVRMKGSMN